MHSALARLVLIGMAIILAVPLSACQSLTPQQSSKLKVGLLPIVDVLPMYVAEAEGYFKERNVDVELVLFPSALERDAALQAGQIDGQLNDLVSVALLNKDAERVQVVRLTYHGSPAKPMIAILASPNSGINGPADLKGKEIAISSNTVIEYVADRLLQSSGVSPSEVKKTEITKIPVRAEMLTKGQIAAGVLPEPLASLTVQQGAHLVVDDGQSGIGQSVMSFRTEAIKERPEAIRRFLAAYDQAVEAINASPDKYRALLIEKAKIPEQVADSFTVPKYPPSSVPSREDVAAVSEWALAKGLIEKAQPYEQVVNASLLPKQ